jgi:hypothetical protein
MRPVLYVLYRLRGSLRTRCKRSGPTWASAVDPGGPRYLELFRNIRVRPVLFDGLEPHGLVNLAEVELQPPQSAKFG